MGVCESSIIIDAISSIVPCEVRLVRDPGDELWPWSNNLQRSLSATDSPLNELHPDATGSRSLPVAPQSLPNLSLTPSPTFSAVFQPLPPSVVLSLSVSAGADCHLDFKWAPSTVSLSPFAEFAHECTSFLLPSGKDWGEFIITYFPYMHCHGVHARTNIFWAKVNIDRVWYYGKEQRHSSLYHLPRLQQGACFPPSPRLLTPVVKIAELLSAAVKREGCKRLLSESFPRTKAQNGFISF